MTEPQDASARESRTAAGPARRPLLWRVVTVAVIAAAAFGAGILVHWAFSPASTTAPEPKQQAQEEKPPTVWTCAMHPEVRLPEPGICPKCPMQLIPVEAGPGGGGLRSTFSETARKLMELETAEAERKFVTATVRMVGKVDYDETRLSYVTAWVPGRLDRLFVDYTGMPVHKGYHMVELYSPDLLTAQEELLQGVRTVKDLKETDSRLLRESAEANVKAAREKLRLLGLTLEQIAQIAAAGKPSDHVTIQSPATGIVIERHARQGQYVQTGSRLFTIADLTHVWVRLDAYESDLMWLRYGQRVRFTTRAYPGRTFTGRISFIPPTLDEDTRTVRIRVNAANPAGKLMPGMFVQAEVRAEVAAAGKVMDPDLAGKWISPMHPEVIEDAPGTCKVCGVPLVRAESLGYVSADRAKATPPLVVPASAVLRTGKRAVVYVEVPQATDPTYELREVRLGPRAGAYYLVADGLKAGERVVVRGAFKIDSERQLQGLVSMMSPPAAGPTDPPSGQGSPGSRRAGRPGTPHGVTTSREDSHHE